MSRVLTFLLLICCVLSCKQQGGSDLYNERARELIHQIFAHEQYACASIIVSELNVLEQYRMERPNFDATSLIMEKLSIRTRHELDSMVLFSKSFVFNENLFSPNSRMITTSELRHVLSERDSLSKFNCITRQKLPEECSKTYYTVCKPVFSSDFSIAVIEIGLGFACLGMPLRVYTRSDGSWQLVK
jgi:hypothetical protein